MGWRACFRPSSSSDWFCVALLAVSFLACVVGVVMGAILVHQSLARQHLGNCTASNTTVEVCMCGAPVVSLCTQTNTTIVLSLSESSQFAVPYSITVDAFTPASASVAWCMHADEVPDSSLSCYYNDKDIGGTLTPYDGGRIWPSTSAVMLLILASTVLAGYLTWMGVATTLYIIDRWCCRPPAPPTNSMRHQPFEDP